jgi:hypothetical protein
MLLKITDNFYQLVNVFSEQLLTEILDRFENKSKSGNLSHLENNIRLECHLHLTNDVLSTKIRKELQPVVETAEKITSKLYQNSPQLWYDSDGYISSLHKDLSNNLTVNVQVYLENGDTSMGTYCFDDKRWYSVPYQCNCGYLMIGPTKLLHGMKYPVKNQRLSLYQSFRSTSIASSIW